MGHGKWGVRLGELILYVAQKCPNDPGFGSVKLNKILWMCDFRAYEELEEPITGVEYMRLQNGPAPRKLVPVRDRLVENGDALVIGRRTWGGRKQKRVFALRDADLSLFTGAQIDLVNDVTKICGG